MCSCSVVFSSSIRFRFIRSFLQIERMQDSSIWFPLSVCCRFQACWKFPWFACYKWKNECEKWKNECVHVYIYICVCLVYRLLCLKITQKWHETTLTTPNIPKEHSLQIPSRERIHIPPGEKARKSSTQKCQKLGNMLVFFISIFSGGSVDVSKNRATPKWMIYNGKPYSNGRFWGVSLFLETPMYFILLYPLASQMLNCWTRAPPVAVASVRGKQSEVLHLPGNLGFSKKIW